MWVTAIFFVVLLVGLAGTLIPVLPGLVLMWAAVVGFGFVAGFDAVGIAAVGVVTALTVIALGLGVVLPKRAADAAGASAKSQFAAVFGAIIGFFVIPVVGAFVGVLAGVAVVEYLEKREWAPAWASTKAVVVGMGTAALAQFAIGAIILAIWMTWAAAHLS